MQPETRYAKSGDVHIAYQVVGDGPVDLVSIPGWVSHLDLAWEDPAQARFVERLAGFSRLVRFDKRGTGLSDPVASLPTLEQRMDDVRVVMDAAGLEQAALFGHSDGAQIGLLFAATYPWRTRALITHGACTRAASPGEDLWGDAEMMARFRDAVDHWGEGRSGAIINPDVETDPVALAKAARWERMCASPAMARALHEANEALDVRAILPSIRIPTLVLHRRGDAVPVGGSRYIAERVPGARFIELAGDQHAPWLGDADAILGEVETFLTGARHSYASERVLATVLFTDIVSSTERLAELGDRRWRDLLDDHLRLSRRELERHRGREVKTTGDGLLASFDGPARAVRCATAILDGVRQLGIEIRAGLHTGEVEVLDQDLGGIAVHTGARVAAEAAPGEVLVSSTVKDLVAGSGITFEDRGVRVLKGVPGEWRLFAVASV